MDCLSKGATVAVTWGRLFQLISSSIGGIAILLQTQVSHAFGEVKMLEPEKKRIGSARLNWGIWKSKLRVPGLFTENIVSF